MSKRRNVRSARRQGHKDAKADMENASPQRMQMVADTAGLVKIKNEPAVRAYLAAYDHEVRDWDKAQAQRVRRRLNGALKGTEQGTAPPRVAALI